MQQSGQQQPLPVLPGPTEPFAHESGQNGDVQAVMKQIAALAVHVVDLGDGLGPVAELLQIAVGNQKSERVQVDAPVDGVRIQQPFQACEYLVVGLDIVRIQQAVRLGVRRVFVVGLARMGQILYR